MCVTSLNPAIVHASTVGRRRTLPKGFLPAIGAQEHGGAESHGIDLW